MADCCNLTPSLTHPHHWDDHITGMITSLGWTTSALTAAAATLLMASNTDEEEEEEEEKEEEEEDDVALAPLTTTSLWACPTPFSLPSAVAREATCALPRASAASSH